MNFMMSMVMKNTIIYSITVLLFGLLGVSNTVAGYKQTVEQILAGNEAPVGIVIEVVSGDENFLNQALPEVSRLSKQLRTRFPGLDVVLVSHGLEMFALTTSSLEQKPKTKKQIKSLLADDMTVHVCGTFASWQGVEESEFPDSINVSPAAPAQINDYVSLGYTQIKISRIK